MRIIALIRDPRGESKDYEAFSLECRDESGRLVWQEGVRKNRFCMYKDARACIEPMLKAAKRCRPNMRHVRACGETGDNMYCACGCSGDDYWCGTEGKE